MNAQANSDNPRLWMKQHGDIQRHDIPRMQWVETDAAAVRVIDGISQQVVKVDQQAAQHEAECLQPFFRVSDARDSDGNEEMQKDMEQS